MNPFDVYDDAQFKKRYRMRKEIVTRLVDLLRNRLQSNSNRGRPISQDLQVLATLRYLAKGAYEEDMGMLI